MEETIEERYKVADAILNQKAAAYHKAKYEYDLAREEFDAAIVARGRLESERKKNETQSAEMRKTGDDENME